MQVPEAVILSFPLAAIALPISRDLWTKLKPDGDKLP
jgi:hypothetical protein